MQRCSGKTKAGLPCRAQAGSGGLCFFHANPEKAQALGQIGGRKNRSRTSEPPAASPLSAADLRDYLVEAIQDVRSNKITPRTGAAISQLCNTLFRVLQNADLEARLAKLEQRLAEEARTSVDSGPTSSGRTDETCSGAPAQSGDVDTPESIDGEDDSIDGSSGKGDL